MPHRSPMRGPQWPDGNRSRSRPSQQALEAMAEAVRRARQEVASSPERGASPTGQHAATHPDRQEQRSDGSPSSTGTPHPASTSVERPPRVYARHEPPVDATPSRSPLAWLPVRTLATWKGRQDRAPAQHRPRTTARLSVAAGVVMAVVIAVVLVASWPSGSPSTSVLANGSRAHAGRHSQVHLTRPSVDTTVPVPSISGKRSGTGGSSTTTSSTTTGAAASSFHITAVMPSSGKTGQLVLVQGTGLYSATGQVVVRFGGRPAPTDCASQTLCTATVPALGAPGTVSVTVTIQSGTSNAIPFDYRG